MIDIASSKIGPAKITVIGAGGGGNNAVDRMMLDGVDSIEFISVNTDHQALERSIAPIRIQLGEKLTKGLGAGGNPDIGRRAAEETKDEIAEALNGTNMLFITAGMGGGTGTGSAPIIASIAKDLGILTVAVVTKPFRFEGAHRMRNAIAGIVELKKYVDTLVVIPNQKLLEIIERDTSVIDSFKKADEVLRQGVQGIADLISKPGQINLDFADVYTIMSGKGLAHMGVGRASGKNKTELAAELAIKSPLLETSISGAKSVLISIAGDTNLSLIEADSAATYITQAIDPNAEIIFGTSINDDLADEVVITVIATGLDDGEMYSEQTKQMSRQSITQTPPRQQSNNNNNSISNNNMHEQNERHVPQRPAFDEKGALRDNFKETSSDLLFEIPVFLQNKKR